MSRRLVYLLDSSSTRSKTDLGDQGHPETTWGTWRGVRVGARRGPTSVPEEGHGDDTIRVGTWTGPVSRSRWGVGTPPIRHSRVPVPLGVVEVVRGR